MMPQVPLVYHEIEQRLKRADSSHCLCDTMIEVIGRFAEMVIKLNEARMAHAEERMQNPVLLRASTAPVGGPAAAGNSDSRGNGGRPSTTAGGAPSVFSMSGLAYSAQAKRCYEDKTVPLHEIEAAHGLQGLMNGTLSADKFRIACGMKSPKQKKGGGRKGLPQSTSSGLANTSEFAQSPAAARPQPPPHPPLALLGSMRRHNMIAVIQKLETMSQVGGTSSPNRSAGDGAEKGAKEWRMPSTETRQLAIELLKSKSTKTVAGAAKMMLILLHPRLEEDEKVTALPRAALADIGSDTDELAPGEKRLLKAVVKCIVAGRGLSMISAADRAVATARRKHDVLEIVQVMVYSCQSATKLPYIGGSGSGERGGGGNRGGAGRGSESSARNTVSRGTTPGNSRPDTSVYRENKKSSSRGKNFFGDDDDAMMDKVTLRAKNQPAPPPPRRPPESNASPAKKGRGARGLSSVRSLRRKGQKREDSGVPPSSLFSYMGAPTIFQQNGDAPAGEAASKEAITK